MTEETVGSQRVVSTRAYAAAWISVKADGASWEESVIENGMKRQRRSDCNAQMTR